MAESEATRLLEEQLRAAEARAEVARAALAAPPVPETPK